MSATKPNEIVFLVKALKEGGYEANSLGHGLRFRGASQQAMRDAVRAEVKAHFAKAGSAPGPERIRLHFLDDMRIIAMVAE